MTVRRLWFFFALLATIIVISYYLAFLTPRDTQPKLVPHSSNTVEADTGSYYNLLDSRGRTILQTGFPVNIGDEFIDGDNQRYRVSSLSAWDGVLEQVSRKTASTTMAVGGRDKSIAVQAPVNRTKRIAIYHTHSDESFLPSSGTSSETKGGAIYRVGYALASSLVDDGFEVDQSFALHSPHDIYAYQRSRRTFFRLLLSGPEALFDIHRDSAPAEAYFTYITGVESARVMIVVGSQNPHMSSNLAFAQKIKDQADKLYPGLIRGIFIGRGSYNQDLAPQALLFEISTERLPEQLAQNAAHCLGDVLATVL